MATVLILDDEPVIREVLGSVLAKAGHATREAATAAEGLQRLEKEPVDLLLLDLMLPDRPGLEVLVEVRARHPEIPVVVVTAYSSVESAITAMREGAFHYIPKPFRNEEVVHVVRQALEKRRLVAENRALRAKLDAPGGFRELVGRSAAMERVFETVRQAAASRSTVLVTGESGTGKELVAKALHRLSPRSAGPFVTVHSGALPPDLLESNLFGHVRGSFTGAVADKKGLFKAADGGTIFFDEIGTVPIDTQAKLLRVLQEREFTPVGAVEPIHSDVRVIAATNADLTRAVAEGRFREDLFYRLCVITVNLPPLRERKDDIVPLANSFIRKFSGELKKKIEGLEPEAQKLLMRYNWPGNIRELENTIERAMLLAEGRAIASEDLRLGESPTPGSGREHAPVVRIPPTGIALDDIERFALIEALKMSNWVQKDAAELLAISPRVMNYKIKTLGIEFPRGRRAAPLTPMDPPIAAAS